MHNIGVFLALEAFRPLEAQLDKARELGFTHADITNTNSGGSMFSTMDIDTQVSLDDNPFEIVRTFEKHGITPTTVCAHAALLEPSSPATFATDEIMKAIRFAAAVGIKDVVTTEAEATSEWSKNLTYEQRIFVIAEKLYIPCIMAKDYGVRLLLEPHGPVTTSIEGLEDIFKMLDHPDSLGVNMDTGNSWLGGTDPVEMAKRLKDKIHHIHWKDLGAEWVEKRGTMYGCGFSGIAIGDGVIDIQGVVDVLKDANIANSTLEIAGSPDIYSRSVEYLRSCGM